MALQTNKRFSTWIGGFLFVLPSIVAVAIFVYGMIAWTVRISLTNRISASIKEPKFVGLQNYRDLLTDSRFTHAFENLLKFTVVFIVGTTIAGFIMALLLEKGIKGEGFFRSFYLYPLAISFIAMGTVWNWLLNSNVDADAGGLNLLLQKVGLGFLQNPWYLSESGAAYALALPAIWQMAGYVLALFLAGFRGIPDDLREAARVDGASEAKIYRLVLLPQLTPTLFTVLIILGHVSMKIFDLVIGINGKSYVTQVVAVYMWEATFDQRNYAKGTAIAMVLLIMIALIIVPYLRWVVKQEEGR
ncbi:MAG: sugar ABC transporter permease [Actinobacteria bacterium]|uniref:Sugar ABC transporter permease n=1 Tax=Candidatus Fonsibacter lacus TaxID=2576439 RepID=A0A965GE32_9PROT|nr:sugar ABC transporter permease [Candidatus Fonsibacter lacus]